MYSGIFYRRFVLGEWTAAEGRIYDFYAPGEYAQEAPAEPWERLRVSVDYGTVNPTSMGLWALKDGVWYAWTNTTTIPARRAGQKTDEEYVDALEELTRGRRIERVIVDRRRRASSRTLRRRGFPRDAGEQRGGGRTAGDGGSSEEAEARDLPELQGLPAGDGELRMGERRERTRRAPRKENDHAMDEMRYFAMSVAAGRGAMPDRVRGDKNDELERSGRTVKRRKKEQTGGAAAAVQVRERGGHPFAALRGYMPLGGADAALYRSVREAVPIVDAAIGKLVRLSGGFRVLCEDERAQEELGKFLRTVNVDTRRWASTPFWTSIWIRC